MMLPYGALSCHVVTGNRFQITVMDIEGAKTFQSEILHAHVQEYCHDHHA